MMTDSAAHAQIHETLVAFDAESKMYPLLAASWEQVSDTEWVFKLREGVTFHNGEPFNADAVVFNAERIMGEWGQPRNTRMTRTLDHAEKINDYTVKLVTKAPHPEFPTYLTGFWFVAPGQVEKLGDENYGEHPVGTGPYKFVERVPDDHLTLEANLDYWGELPAIKTAIYRIIPEAASRVTALKAGEVDIAEYVPIDSYDVVDSDPNLSATYVPGGRSPLGFFLPDSPQNPDAVALNDLRVRQAINHAVNVEALTESLFAGLTHRMSSTVGPHNPAYDPSVEPYTYDPDKARELLAEAGYPELTLNLQVPSTGPMITPIEVGEFIVNDLEQVGIHATLVPVELAALLGERDERRAAPIFIVPWGQSFPDPYFNMFYILHSKSPYSMMSDPKLDDLIDAAGTEMDPEKRLALYSQAQQFTNDQAFLLFLYSQPFVFGYNNRVIGFAPRTDERVVAYGCSLAE